MSNQQLGPLDVECDAPAYAIVHACQNVGIRTPEDVRWCRMSHFLARSEGWKGLFQFLNWESLMGRVQNGEMHCSCGAGLPILETVTFTFTSGRDESLLLGQCARCGTVFWEEA
jgi:hypothetical protein